MKKKYFIITVDTEGDNVWSYIPRKGQLLVPEIKNALYLHRFQQLCEDYEFYPTYFVDYEMAKSSEFIKFGIDIIKRNKGEIGMHMHAFSTPPFYELSDLRGRGLAFAGEYPSKILYQKMEYMTKILQDTFQIEIPSHRGGRWYLDRKVLKILEKLGYLVDCTVTPGVNWQSARGQTGTSRGSDYRHYKSGAYQIKKSGLWELPVTIRNKITLDCTKRDGFPVKIKKIWLRPDGKNLEDMIWLVDKNRRSVINYVEFMIHSSELMEGGNPVFKTAEEIDNLYKQIAILFAYIKQNGYQGIGCSNYIRENIKLSK